MLFSALAYAVLLLTEALTTLPDLMQLVHTLTRLVEPFNEARTRWMFGFQRRLVRRCECDTDMPQEGPLPHTSQTDAMTYSCEELLRVRAGALPVGTSPDG